MLSTLAEKPDSSQKVHARQCRDSSPRSVEDVEISSKDFAKLCGRCTFTVQSWARSGAIRNCRKDPEQRQKWLFKKNAALAELAAIENVSRQMPLKFAKPVFIKN